MLAYPTPHHIRRNFTLFPFASPGALQLFPNDPAAPPLPKGLMINITMTKEKVDHAVNNYEGDFIGFQANAESVSVNPTLPPRFSVVLTRPYRASMAEYISSSLGKRAVASGSLHHLTLDELPKGREWQLSQRCPRRLSCGTNVVSKRSLVLHAPCGSCHLRCSFHRVPFISPYYDSADA